MKHLFAMIFGALLIAGCSTDRPQSDAPRSDKPQAFIDDVKPSDAGVDAAGLAEIDELLQSFIDEKKHAASPPLPRRMARLFMQKRLAGKIKKVVYQPLSMITMCSSPRPRRSPPLLL